MPDADVPRITLSKSAGSGMKALGDPSIALPIVMPLSSPFLGGWIREGSAYVNRVIPAHKHGARLAELLPRGDYRPTSEWPRDTLGALAAADQMYYMGTGRQSGSLEPGAFIGSYTRARTGNYGQIGLRVTPGKSQRLRDTTMLTSTVPSRCRVAFSKTLPYAFVKGPRQ
jgi:hypothetical protein